MRLVFMGTPDFARTILEGLIQAGHEVACVLTQPDRPGNRGKITVSPVKELAVAHGIEVLQPDRLSKSEEAKARLREIAPDAAIVAAYGQILKKDVLEIPRLGCFNIHASLLPKLRGASPIQHAILSGEETTGVTLMRIDEGLDTGDMVAKAEVAIGRLNSAELSEELAKAGSALLLEELPRIAVGEAVYVPQNDAEASYAGMIAKSDGLVDFSQPAAAIERKIRAFDPWPGAFAEGAGGRVRLWAADALTDRAEAAPGRVCRPDL